MYIHIYPCAPHGLSPADLTETYRCRAIRRERPTSRLANPSTRELCRKIVAEFQLLPTGKYGADTRGRRNKFLGGEREEEECSLKIFLINTIACGKRRFQTQSGKRRELSRCDLKGI